MSNSCFVTGCIRSGTTLVEKLLCNHPAMSVLSQPFPTLYFDVKKQFLESIGVCDEYFLLSHYVDETRYSLSDFNQFLKASYVPLEAVRDALHTEYDGKLSNAVEFSLQGDNSLVEVYSHLCKANSHNNSARLFGSKEVLCEEFVPYFLENGLKVIHILRDPRDVVSSIKFGKGEDFIGRIKPLLFELRNWRKSAQLAIQFVEHPLFKTIQYEDLVLEPKETLNELCDFLEIDRFSIDAFKHGILSQNGDVWSSNSSFDSVDGIISKRSVGGFHNRLSTNVIEYIETITAPELQKLKNQPIRHDNWQSIISNFVEPQPPTDTNLPSNYSTTSKAIEYELQRYSEFESSGKVRFEFSM